MFYTSLVFFHRGSQAYVKSVEFIHLVTEPYDGGQFSTWQEIIAVISFISLRPQ